MVEALVMKSRIRIALVGVVTALVQFGLAIYFFGGWSAFFSHSALLGLGISTLAMMVIAPFSNGNVSSGEKEDRGNRWVLTAFSVVALLTAIAPPWADRHAFATFGGEGTRWIGVALYTVGGALRLWPVFVLGRRFSGLVAIQSGHTLETRGIYTYIRNPSYLGLLINMVGWGLAFRGWTGIAIALVTLVPLVSRMRAEERLLRAHFGAEYEAYRGRTWRLVPGVY